MNLIVKYRPTKFLDILGQEETCKSLKSVLAKNSTHAFLLTGPTGVGKTTLARIIAAKLKCDQRNIVEVDAASNTGIDDMRHITEGMVYNALGANPNRFYILDEAHMLSKQAWASLLKSVEEPPETCYWAFCTTESLKIPPAIRTRCAQYTLNPVDGELIYELLLKIIKAEGFTTSEDVAYFLAQKAGGSPRQAIACLAQCSSCTSRKEAARLIQSVETEGDVGKLIQALMQGSNWVKCCEILKGMDSVAPESIRIIISNYFTKVALDAKSEQKAEKAMAVLQAFSQPYPQYVTGLGPVLLSLGELLL